MATQTKIIHIGHGQVTGDFTNTDEPQYATYADFVGDFGAGLDTDLSAETGADEDWEVLFYGDNANELDITVSGSFADFTFGDSIITYRPATGHAWFDSLDFITDAYTFHGAAKGVTCKVNENRTLVEAADAGSVRIAPGFQFRLAAADASVVYCNTRGQGVTVEGAIIYGEHADIRVPMTIRSDTTGSSVRNNLIVLTADTSALSGSNFGSGDFSGNICAYIGAAASTKSGAFIRYASGENIMNNLMFGFQTAMQLDSGADLGSNLTDDTEANAADMTGQA